MDSPRWSVWTEAQWTPPGDGEEFEPIAAFAMSRREVERHFETEVIVEDDWSRRPGPMGYVLIGVDGVPSFIFEVHYGVDEPEQESLLYGLLSRDLAGQRELFLKGTGVDYGRMTEIRVGDEWKETPRRGPE